MHRKDSLERPPVRTVKQFPWRDGLSLGSPQVAPEMRDMGARLIMYACGDHTGIREERELGRGRKTRAEEFIGLVSTAGD